MTVNIRHFERSEESPELLGSLTEFTPRNEGLGMTSQTNTLKTTAAVCSLKKR